MPTSPMLQHNPGAMIIVSKISSLSRKLCLASVTRDFHIIREQNLYSKTFTLPRSTLQVGHPCSSGHICRSAQFSVMKSSKCSKFRSVGSQIFVIRRIVGYDSRRICVVSLALILATSCYVEVAFSFSRYDVSPYTHRHPSLRRDTVSLPSSRRSVSLAPSPALWPWL